MPKYNLYAGLKGAFGGASYITTKEFASGEEARQEAYHLAMEEYHSYAGYHRGILDWDDCREAIMEDNNYEEPDPSDVDDYYLDEIEFWIEYYITPYDPNNPPKE